MTRSVRRILPPSSSSLIDRCLRHAANIGFIIDDSSMARRPEYAKEETRLGWHNRRTDECLAIGGAESLYIALCDNRDMRGADKLEEVIKRQRATKRQQRRGKKTAPSGEKGSYIDKLKKVGRASFASDPQLSLTGDFVCSTSRRRTRSNKSCSKRGMKPTANSSTSPFAWSTPAS